MYNFKLESALAWRKILTDPINFRPEIYIHQTKSETKVYISIKSKVEIDPAMQRDAGYYECQAYNKYAVDIKVSILFKSLIDNKTYSLK